MDMMGGGQATQDLQDANAAIDVTDKEVTARGRPSKSSMTPTSNAR